MEDAGALGHAPSISPTGRSRTRDEAGFSALEMAILFPVTLFIVFGIVQFGIWYHANDVARAAAQEAVRSASAYQATNNDGTAAANQVLDQDAKGLIIHTSVSVSRGGSVATVTVTGDALQVLPFISLPVKVKATAPVEAFRPPPRA